MKTETQNPLAIVGIGCLFPKADGLGAYWSNLKEGVDAITEIPKTHWDTSALYDADPKKPDMTYGKRGGFLDAFQFDPMKYGLAPKDLEATDTSQLLGLVAAQKALEDAGYGEGGKPFDRERVSVLLGVTGTLELVIPLGARLGHPIWRKALEEAGVDKDTSEDVVQRIADGYVGWQENSFPGLLGNVVAGRIANRLDLHGTNCVVDAACASSFSALHLAGMELAAGRSDMVIAGGVDTFNDIFMYMCFSKTPALSPSGNSKPFDADGDGTILGEGIGITLLKRLEDAERDGDKIYAVVKGVGSSSDGKGGAIYEPNAEGQARALRRAYEAAGVTPDTIEMVEAHGTGTKVGDAVEAKGLAEVYRAAKGEGTWCALGSVKSQIGHTKAAAGSAGLIKAVLALKHKVLPPTIKVGKPNAKLAPGTTPFYVNTVKRPWLPREEHPRRAGVSAFGFGGSNFHTVVEEYGSKKDSPDWDGDVQVLAFSADAPEALGAGFAKLPDGSDWAALRRAAARSRGAYDAGRQHRLLLVVEKGKTDLARTLNAAKDLVAKGAPAASPLGIYYGAGKPQGKLAALFPGQGAQYVGMQRDLACLFPEMLDTLAEANAAAESMRPAPEARDGRSAGGANRLSDKIYPFPTFDDAAAAANTKVLTDTRVAQPAIGAASLGALRVLARFGVEPDLAAGHSYGELTALCASGVLEPADFHRASNLRGELMGSGAGDLGSMIAVLATIESVEALVKDAGLDLVLANKNAPEQVVLSGASAECDRAEGVLKEKGFRFKRLPVGAAFHSPLVAGAAKPFAEALKKTAWGKQAVPVYANTTGEVYPSSAAQARELLGNQLAKPVEFVAVVRNMRAAGASTFLEIGPGARLTGLASTILKGEKAQAFALDTSNGKASGVADLAKALAQLSAEGRRVDWSQWDEGVSGAEPVKPKFAVPISGANYRAPRKSIPPRAVKPAPRSEMVSQPSTEPSPVWCPPGTPSETAKNTPVSSALSEAMKLTQQNLDVLKAMQEQTALLHQQFLNGQLQAQQTINALVEQQKALFGGAAVQPLRLPTPQPVVAAPAPEPVVEAPKPSGGSSKVQSVLLDVVSEKTGYPVEMLNLEMGLDSDLGIDSIKRVEILSALQEKLPQAPVVKPEQLGTLRTLGQIVEFLSEGAAEGIPAQSAGTLGAPEARSEVQEVLLDVVSEKTGYPVEMLNLEMGLDSDLGIDSIKRVEILSALQEKLPEAPVVKPEQLGTLRTLGQIVEFLAQGSAAPAPVPAPVAAPAADDNTKNVLLDVVSDKTGYPVEMLNLDMGLDSDLGIDSIKRVEILSALQEKLPEAPVVKPDQLGTLRTLGQIVAFLSGGSPSKAAPATAAPAVARKEPHVVAGVSVQALNAAALSADRPAFDLPAGSSVWITDDENGLSAALAKEMKDRGFKSEILGYGDWADKGLPGKLGALILVAPRGEVQDAWLREALMLAKRAGRNAALFATVSRLDGMFGLGDLGAERDARSGALAGLAKTAAREWDNRCRAFDVDAEWSKETAAAAALADELLRQGPVETGLTADGLNAPALVDSNPGGEGTLPLRSGDVVVVTGGARGVTAEVAYALADAVKPKLVLLGRSPAPSPEPDWLSSLEDEAAIKKALLAHGEGKLTPKDLQDAYKKAMANREMLRNIARIEKTGASVTYRSLDARDPKACAALIEDLRENEGPVRGLLHGAGVLADRLIADKTREQFDAVYGTKVPGLRALLGAIGDGELRALVLFSSSTARFGRKGQVDYAMANEALNKIARVEAARRPRCRVVSVNWGPWEGGMVTPELRGLFEAEGVKLIPLKAGAEYLLDELRRAGGPVETVVLGAGSAQPAPDAAPAPESEMHPAFERALSTDTHPFLKSHVMDGRAVLPMAVILEWLAHGALHGQPGLTFRGFDDFRILKGVILEPGESRVLRVLTGEAKKSGDAWSLEAELRSVAGGKPVTHARARIVLGVKPETAPEAKPEPRLGAPKLDADKVYAEVLFHGEDLRAIRALEGLGAKGIAADVAAAPAPSDWIEKPLRSRWIADPLALDAAFQMLIVWSREQQGAGSLPVFARSLRQYRKEWPKSGVRVVARVTESGKHRALSDVDFVDESGALVARMEGYECVIDPSLNGAFRRNVLA